MEETMLPNRCMPVIFLLILLVSIPLGAQDSSAVDVQNSCAHWNNLRLNKNKQFKGDSKDVYQTGICFGYFAGLLDGMDNTGGWQLTDKSTAFLHIKRESINSTWDVIRAFYAYVDANPLSNGKPAWSVLQNVLVKGGLATFEPETRPTRPSGLTDECRTGANNLNSQFLSNSELKVIDTATLGSVYQELAACLDTKNLNDADTALVLTAETEAGSALLSRAITVLDRHSLLPELKAERPASTQDKTLSSLPTTN
jgi:hypothetical protein